jgi:hypothetical protein
VDKPPLNRALGVPPEPINPDKAFPNEAIYELREIMPAVDGDPPLTIGPYTPREATEYDIEPLRVLGWRKRKDARKPIPHAKLLVLGEVGMVDYCPLPGYDEACRFTRRRVWFGSANWTEAARLHLETGFACDDPLLAEQATSFIAEMIAFSEPVASACVGPEPNLVRVAYDDDAIAEAAQELGYDVPDDYDEPTTTTARPANDAGVRPGNERERPTKASVCVLNTEIPCRSGLSAPDRRIVPGQLNTVVTG